MVPIPAMSPMIPHPAAEAFGSVKAMEKDIMSFVSQRVARYCPADAENAIVLRPSKNTYEVYTVQGDNRTIGIDAYPDDTGIFTGRLFIDTDYEDCVSRGFYCDEATVLIHDENHASIVFWNVMGDNGEYWLDRLGTVAVAGHIVIRHGTSERDALGNSNHSLEIVYPKKE